MKSSRRFAFIRLSRWLLLLLLPHALSGATYTWTGAGFFGNQDFLWSNPNNWLELSAPQPGEQDVAIVFPNSAAPRNSTNDVVNLVVSSFVFQGANYGVHGGSNGVTMSLRGVNGGGFAVVAMANGCQFGSSTRLHLASTGTVAVASGALLTVKSRVSGIFGFTKISPGTLSFQGLQANTYTGPTIARHGTIDFRNVGVALPGALIVGDGDPASSPIARLYLNDQISDTSPVTINANGTLALDGHSDTIGALTLASGSVTTGNGATTGVLTLNGNVTNHLGVANVASTITGKLSLGSTTRGFYVDADTELVIGSDISGATAGMSKAGPGRIRLTGAGNSYNGSTTVQAGELVLIGAARPGSIDNGTVVGSGATLTLDHAAIGSEALSLNGTTNQLALVFVGTNSWAGPVTLTGHVLISPDQEGAVFDNVMTFSGNISGAGAMHLVEHGELHFTGLGDNTFSGGFYGEKGLTYFEKTASAQSVGGPVYAGRADLDFPQGSVIVRTLNQIPNSASVYLRNSGSLATQDDATDTIGNVYFEGGWLFVESGAFTISGQVTNRYSAQNVSAIYGNVMLSPGQHLFAFDELSGLDVWGVMGGPGGITKVGRISALHLHNTNTYAGLTEVFEGDLVLEDRGRPGSTAAGTVVTGFGALVLRHVGVTNETLTTQLTGGYAPIIFVEGTNVWKGPVVLDADADIRGYSAPQLTLDGPISGPGGILYRSDPYSSGDGALVLQGTFQNTYQGDTTVLKGSLLLNKQNGNVAIPGNLIIGMPDVGAPAATVSCLGASQFGPVPLAVLNDRKVTIHPSGAFHCNGFDQSVANLVTRGGAVFTQGGILTLQANWQVLDDTGYTYFGGQLRLASPYAEFLHEFNVETNASLFFAGDISQGNSTAHIRKRGAGDWGMMGSNTFSGLFLIDAGRVLAGGVHPFGTLDANTQVASGATLITYGGVCPEAFSLSGSGYAGQGALVILGTNTFTGPVELVAPADIVTPGTTNFASFAGIISGPGRLTKLGQGTVRLAGLSDNTYTGVTRVKAGALELAKTNALALRGGLEIALEGGDALVRYVQSDQVSDLSPVQVGTNGQFRLLGQTDVIGSLAGYGIVELLDGTLITGNDNTATTYAGTISGIGGSLTKTGTNTFTLTGDNAYTGTTFVKNGTLLVRGQQPLSDVTIQTGGTLGGTGRLGKIADLSGHVRPGLNSYGKLQCAGLLTHSPANVFQMEINGTTPGAGHDQLDVNGTVTLMGGTLQVLMNYAGAVSNHYVIIKNDGTDAITGTFVGLPPNAYLTNNGVVFQISYAGGDGNDIVLIQKGAAIVPQAGAVERLPNGTTQIAGTGVPNTTYRVEATENLASPAQWQDIGQTTTDPTGRFVFVDLDASLYPIRFYRFRVP